MYSMMKTAITYSVAGITKSVNIAGSVWSYIATSTSSKEPLDVFKRVMVKGEKQKGILYAFETNVNRFKVGKTINLKQRVRQYNTVFPDGEVVHTVECDDIHHAEKVLHSLLIMGGYHVKQEIFEVPLPVLKNFMDIVRVFDKNVVKPSKMSKIDKVLKNIT